MTIFKEKLDEEYLTTSEVKELLAEVEAERAADEEREMRYELARAIEHVNRFAHLDPEESLQLVEELAELEKVDTPTAYKIANLRPLAATSSAPCSLSSGTRSTATNSTRSSTSSRSTRNDASVGCRRLHYFGNDQPREQWSLSAPSTRARRERRRPVKRLGASTGITWLARTT